MSSKDLRSKKIRAFVLLIMRPGTSEEIVQSRKIKGVTMANSVLGRFDAIAVVEANNTEELTKIICEMIEATLEESPPELSGDIMERGLYLTGGVACLGGLDKYISQRTGVTVHLAEEPLLSVVMGVGKLLENRHLLSLVEMTP